MFIAILEKDDTSDFGVMFPDLPGVVTAGTTLDEASTMAVEALAMHIEGMIEDGAAIPEPSTLEAIMADPENRDGVAFFAVPVSTMTPDRCTEMTLEVRAGNAPPIARHPLPGAVPFEGP